MNVASIFKTPIIIREVPVPPTAQLVIQAANDAKTAAESARDAASTSESNANTYKNDAQTAKTAAESARDAASTSESNANTYKNDAQTAKTAAESARYAAATSESNANTYKIDAQTAKTAAELARDVALIQAGVYTTEPLGRAAVADGVAFKVQGSGDVAAYEYRRVDASSSTLIATYPSSAALSFVDRSTEYFVYGGQALEAIVDSAGRVLATWLADGILRAKLGLQVDSTSPITLTFDTATGLTTVSLTTARLETAEQYIGNNKVIGGLTDTNLRAYLAMFEDGRTYIPKLLVDTIVSNGVITATAVTLSGVDLATMLTPETVDQYIGNNKVIGSLTDSDRRAYLAMFENGQTYIPKLTADTLKVGGTALNLLKPPADSASYVFQEETISSAQQIMRRTKSNGQITQITSTDDNYAPAISYDGANVIYTTTRTTPNSLYYQPVAGGTEYPYESTELIFALGNSISTTGSGYVTALAGLRPTETLSVQGVSGQRTDDIAYRTGATALTCSVTGASIPASGGVTVTGLNTTLFRRTTGTASVKATISGIAGVLSWASSVATFTRTSAGSITAVTNPVAVTITSGFVDGSTDPSAQPTLDTLLSGTAVMVLTYNDIKEATYSQSTTLANVAAIVARLKPLVKRLIIVGDCIGQGRLTAAQFPANPAPPADAATSELWITRSLALNAALLAAYPDNYLDMQGILITAGYSTVFNVNGTNYDVINLTVFPDGIHPTSGGSTIFANIINNIFITRGW